LDIARGARLVDFKCRASFVARASVVRAPASSAFHSIFSMARLHWVWQQPLSLRRDPLVSSETPRYLRRLVT